MTGHGAKFGRKMEAAIAALVARPSIEDAARAAGVGEKTLRRWMREPEFKATYLQVRWEGVHQAAGRLQHATGAAASIMLKLMTDPNVPAAVRLSAAESVFDRGIKGIELEDVDARLTALEQASPQGNQRR
jgi:hypothetical protein